MSEFEKKLPPCRLAQINAGDTLQRIAAREMGDANRWPELVWINSLTWPYLTADPAAVAPGILLHGSPIQVPAPVGFITDDGARGQIYERDCALVNRLLQVDDGGDLLVVNGVDNLRQQLKHVVDTPRGQAARHPTYGNRAWQLLGRKGGPTASKMAAAYTRTALQSDYRVSRVDYSTAEVTGDAIRGTARVVAIEGGIVDVVIS